MIAGLLSLIPGVGPVFGIAATALGYILRCKPCLYALGTAALCAWTAIHIHRADVVRCDGRIADDHARAEVARQQRDAGVKLDLENKYQPQISALEQRAKTLQGEVTKYANRKPIAAAGARPAPPAGDCKLGADPLQLRHLPPG